MDSLAREFPRILRRIQELNMEFIFAEPNECNLHMVQEFYSNWVTDSRSHFVKVRGIDVTLTPALINDIVGTSQDTDPLGLHYTDITRDRVCLVYALMTSTKLNIGAILKSIMKKACVHKGSRYTFGGLITRLCHDAGVPEEHLDYMAPLFPTPVDITRTKGPDTEFGPTLTTAERHRRDELIMARMYGLEMLRHQNG
uniref:Putative plant transposon protein domain-containing protein n=1 Tax=Solanum tuberosum TaxID=4113 RepID=M1DNK7_SOLTU